jgi:hypothetical protein
VDFGLGLLHVDELLEGDVPEHQKKAAQRLAWGLDHSRTGTARVNIVTSVVSVVGVVASLFRRVESERCKALDDAGADHVGRLCESVDGVDRLFRQPEPMADPARLANEQLEQPSKQRMAGGEPVKGLALARFGLWVEKKCCVGAKRCDTSLSNLGK